MQRKINNEEIFFLIFFQIFKNFFFPTIQNFPNGHVTVISQLFDFRFTARLLGLPPTINLTVKPLQ